MKKYWGKFLCFISFHDWCLPYKPERLPLGEHIWAIQCERCSETALVEIIFKKPKDQNE